MLTFVTLIQNLDHYNEINSGFFPSGTFTSHVSCCCITIYGRERDDLRCPFSSSRSFCLPKERFTFPEPHGWSDVTAAVWRCQCDSVLHLRHHPSKLRAARADTVSRSWSWRWHRQIYRFLCKNMATQERHSSCLSSLRRNGKQSV